MADSEAEGARNLVVLVVVSIAIAALLTFVFIIREPAAAQVAVPDVQGRGLQWGLDRVTDAGFNEAFVYDSAGRARETKDQQEWMICFQTPPPGKPLATNEKVQLGVMRVSERCPRDDAGAKHPVALHADLPDQYGRTAYMVRQDYGDRASLRFLDIAEEGQASSDPDHAVVDDDLGEWKVCSQEQTVGTWEGQPLVFHVVTYDAPCP